MGEVLALGEMLAARTVWRAGQGVATRRDGEPSGHAALDAALPDGGWPRRALTELLLPSDGVGEIALLLPTLARLTAAGERVVLIAPPYLPYAPSWQAGGIDLGWLEVIEAEPKQALCWAGRRPAMHARCAACRWPPTVATAAPSRCATGAMR
jgi:hypothetical protein